MLIEWLLKLDYYFFNLINQKGAFDLGDVFFPFITDLHKTIYFKIIFTLLILFIFFKKYQRSGLSLFFLLLLSLSTSDFLGSVVKNQFLRERPFQNSEISATQKSPAGSKSFYSNHSSNMFNLAVYTTAFVPILKIPLFSVAVLIAYSRIYNGVHYPSDVIAGAVAGSLIAFLYILLSKKLLKYLGEKYFKNANNDHEVR